MNRIRLQRIANRSFDFARQLTKLLGVRADTTSRILHGDLSSISALELIKLFLVTGLALDIKPLDEALRVMQSEARQHGIPTPDGHIPSSDWTPNPRLSQRFEQNRHENVATAATRTGSQPRDRFGRFTSRHEIPLEDSHATLRSGEFAEAEHVIPTEDNPYERMSSEDLKNMIHMNLWDSEINLATASHQELVNFILDKERCFAEVGSRFVSEDDANQQATMPEQRQEVVDDGNGRVEVNVERCGGERPSLTSFAGSNKNVEAFVNGLAQLLQSNPQLSEQIAKFVRH